ncbi:MAG: type II toxin-antitoxin system VapC family toxin [Bryobacteraceae bacterium]
METLRVTILIDTDVFIEYLRGSSSAETWLDSLEQEAFAIPGVVAMEQLLGCRNAIELAQIRRFIAENQVVWPDDAVFARAYEILCSFRLSSGLGIPDCLIAAMALDHGVRLYTFNLKHFKAVPGLDAQQPYVRQ